MMRNGIICTVLFVIEHIFCARNSKVGRKEYLANLREFHKCKSGKREREVEVGDVVVVYEEERKRGEWKMGVVERLVTGRDNVVRGATVRVVTKGKPIRLSRPVQKLYPLEFRSEGEGVRALTERNRNISF